MGYLWLMICLLICGMTLNSSWVRFDDATQKKKLNDLEGGPYTNCPQSSIDIDMVVYWSLSDFRSCPLLVCILEYTKSMILRSSFKVIFPQCGPATWTERQGWGGMKWGWNEEVGRLKGLWWNFSCQSYSFLLTKMSPMSKLICTSMPDPEGNAKMGGEIMSQRMRGCGRGILSHGFKNWENDIVQMPNI